MSAGTPQQKPDQTGTGTASEPCDVSSVDVVPSRQPRAVYVSVTGNIACRLVGDSVDSTWNNVPVGDWPRAVSKIYHVGTTATIQYFIY